MASIQILDSAKSATHDCPPARCYTRLSPIDVPPKLAGTPVMTEGQGAPGRVLGTCIGVPGDPKVPGPDGVSTATVRLQLSYQTCLSAPSLARGIVSGSQNAPPPPSLETAQKSRADLPLSQRCGNAWRLKTLRQMNDVTKGANLLPTNSGPPTPLNQIGLFPHDALAPYMRARTATPSHTFHTLNFFSSSLPDKGFHLNGTTRLI